MNKKTKTAIESSQLYKKITDDANIYYSIYSVKSYIFEKELLSKADYCRLIKLSDNFNKTLITKTIKAVKDIIRNVLIEDNLFQAEVFFRPKKIDKPKHVSEFIGPEVIVSRPMHVADLNTQIAIASILNAILLDENNNKYELNELGHILPKNFYGNIPSEKPEYLFEPWQKQYKDYSNTISESYSRFLETKEYSHEISIDLENFFPSIQPIIVYKKIIGILSGKYKNDDMECLKYCLIKLLYMELKNYNGGKYYELKKNTNYNLKINYTQGIPQGLPQSYLFGNICMLDVSEIYEKLFDGLAYYYVDDSIIYTNQFKKQNPENLTKEFEKRLKELNKKLLFLDIDKNGIKIELEGVKTKYRDDILAMNDLLEYKIKAHEITTKSEISAIADEKIGKPYLKILGKIASLSSFELMTTFSDSEEFSLTNKFNEFKNSVEAEIERIDEISGKESEIYKKYLIRYKKFMKFRARLLVDRSKTIKDDEHIKRVENSFKLKIDSNKLIKTDELELFFNEYNEGILVVELLFILRNNYNESFYKKIKKTINEFDKKIFGQKNYKHSYLSKMITNLSVHNNLIKKNVNRYESIKEIIDRNYPDFSNKQSIARSNFINDISNEIDSNGPFFENIHYMFKHGECFRLINKSTDELYRQVLKTLISKVYSVSPEDNIKVVKKGNKSILYKEYRTIVYLNNKRFKLKQFVEFLNYKIKNSANDILDYSLMEVVDYFVAFVKEPKYVDDLIQIHRYTSEIWKNGSKFLHFYTLHNQEHAIELIAAAIKFIKNVDYFQISKVDYYILFISCYLHDVSMVLHPDLTKTFINKKNIKSNLITSDYRDEVSDIIEAGIYTVDTGNIKNILIKYFKRIDSYFEELMRDKHQSNSAKFIRKSYDLLFIDQRQI